MVRPRLSKRFIELFTIRNMTRLVFGSARILFRVTSCKRSVASKSSWRDHVLQLG